MIILEDLPSAKRLNIIEIPQTDGNY